jgi:hypothetical protein
MVSYQALFGCSRDFPVMAFVDSERNGRASLPILYWSARVRSVLQNSSTLLKGTP